MLSLLAIVLASSATLNVPITPGYDIIQSWGDPAAPVMKEYPDGTLSNYPAAVSTGTCYANVFQDPTGVGGPQFLSDRATDNPSSDFTFDTINFRDGGPLASFGNHGTIRTQFYPRGTVAGAVGIGDTETPSFLDPTGVSGHVSLTCTPRYYVVVEGHLGANHLNVQQDGGCWSDAGCVVDDAGQYLPFAALHGELTVTSSEARPLGGWGLQYANPVTDGTNPDRWFVDAWGGMGQRHLMIRAQFPKCPADVVLTSPQTQAYYFGAVESTLLYAFDEREWFFCDGSDWQPIRGSSGSFTASTVGTLGGGVVLAALVLLTLLHRKSRAPEVKP